MSLFNKLRYPWPFLLFGRFRRIKVKAAMDNERGRVSGLSGRSYADAAIVAVMAKTVSRNSICRKDMFRKNRTPKALANVAVGLGPAPTAARKQPGLG
jgi:hypothetical protein